MNEPLNKQTNKQTNLHISFVSGTQV